MAIIPQVESTDTKLQRIIDNPCASYWLKDAIRALLKRDCVDAASDAETLAALFRERCDSIVKRNQQREYDSMIRSKLRGSWHRHE